MCVKIHNTVDSYGSKIIQSEHNFMYVFSNLFSKAIINERLKITFL